MSHALRWVWMLLIVAASATAQAQFVLVVKDTAESHRVAQAGDGYRSGGALGLQYGAADGSGAEAVSGVGQAFWAPYALYGDPGR